MRAANSSRRGMLIVLVGATLDFAITNLTDIPLTHSTLKNTHDAYANLLASANTCREQPFSKGLSTSHLLILHLFNKWICINHVENFSIISAGSSVSQPICSLQQSCKSNLGRILTGQVKPIGSKSLCATDNSALFVSFNG
uniref:Secreted protein n=1 Tax=Panstrongylus lignarius TaxID=156445 RepID=A0A224Y0D4_9HEMI